MFERLERRLAALKQQIEAQRKRGWWVTDIDGKMAVSPGRLDPKEEQMREAGAELVSPDPAPAAEEEKPKKRRAKLKPLKAASTESLTYAELCRVPSMDWFECLRDTAWNNWVPLPNGQPVSWQPPIVIVLLRNDTITMWVNKAYESLVPAQFAGEYYFEPVFWQQGCLPKWLPGSHDIVGFKMITGVPLP